MSAHIDRDCKSDPAEVYNFFKFFVHVQDFIFENRKSKSFILKQQKRKEGGKYLVTDAL